MVDPSENREVSKVYCERCDVLFDSRKKYERHLDGHSGRSCESCPLDTAVQRLARLLFGRK